jgi:hypothetical protein
MKRNCTVTEDCDRDAKGFSDAHQDYYCGECGAHILNLSKEEFQ